MRNSKPPLGRWRLPSQARWLLSLLVMITHVLGQQTSGKEISFPPTIVSSNGKLQTTLTLERSTLEISKGKEFNTRLFQGILPGPTIVLQAGDTLEIDFVNALAKEGSTFRRNEFSAPDESNIHFHGLFVSGEKPSDDTTIVVSPGESYPYKTQLPHTHMAGTHWLHSHRHGSSTLQVGGGAALAVIVQDAPGTLSDQVANAKDVLFFVQQLDMERLGRVAQRAGDEWFRYSSNDTDSMFVLVNGQIQPYISVDPGEWIRLRVVFASWLDGTLDLAIPGCEMQLLAKDGVYIPDFPRHIARAPIVPGGRADIMVRCQDPNLRFEIRAVDGRSIAFIHTTSPTIPESTSLSLQPWTPVYPSYLTSLLAKPATNGCSCSTALSGNAINGIPYNPSMALHESFLGAVVERHLVAGNHPYHQHVYPFQLVVGDFGDNGGYDKYHLPGDWHDTITGSGTIRYQPTEYAGKVIIHCHRLTHEDQGMMAIEEVLDPSRGRAACRCTETLRFPVSQAWTFLFVTVFLFAALVTTAKEMRKRSRRTSSTDDGNDDLGKDEYATVSQLDLPY